MDDPKKKSGMYMAVGGICLLLIVVGISKMTIDYTSEPSFCGGCHLMQTRFISYKRSVHKDATCISCHTAPGFIGEMKGHINGVKYLYYDYKGYRTTQILHAEVENEACMLCHDTSDMDKSMENMINSVQQTSHQSHVFDMDISCTECHGNIMHVTMLGTAERTAIASCRNCHNQTDFVAQID